MAESDPATTGTFATSGESVRSYRFDRYLALGFTVEQAGQLADARWTESVECRDGVRRPTSAPLYHGRVADALAGGCSHVQALAIFADNGRE